MPDGNATCPECGSERWTPTRDKLGTESAFVLTHEGDISGYAGTVRCVECGELWPGPYQGLRVEEA